MKNPDVTKPLSIKAQILTKKVTIAYWAVTLLLCMQLLATGVAFLLLAAPMVETITHVGFPETIIPFFGIMKILGALTLLLIPAYDLRIGAYAGILFYSLGAVAAHITVGDPVQLSLPAALMGALSLFSYFLWKKRYAATATKGDIQQVQPSRPSSQRADIKASSY